MALHIASKNSFMQSISNAINKNTKRNSQIKILHKKPTEKDQYSIETPHSTSYKQQPGQVRKVHSLCIPYAAFAGRELWPYLCR